MSRASSDPAAAIPSNEAAIVTASGMTELELVLPDVDVLPEAAQFLVACAMRYHADAAFVQEQLAWVAARTEENRTDEGMSPDELNASNDG
jgi:hypothetical protein